MVRKFLLELFRLTPTQGYFYTINKLDRFQYFAEGQPVTVTVKGEFFRNHKLNRVVMEFTNHHGGTWHAPIPFHPNQKFNSPKGK